MARSQGCLQTQQRVKKNLPSHVVFQQQSSEAKALDNHSVLKHRLIITWIKHTSAQQRCVTRYNS